MTNAVAIFSPLDRVTDDDGNPVSGALINVYAVGTTSPLDVYSDQVLSTVLPNPVVCNYVGHPTSDPHPPPGTGSPTSQEKPKITKTSKKKT